MFKGCSHATAALCCTTQIDCAVNSLKGTYKYSCHQMSFSQVAVMNHPGGMPSKPWWPNSPQDMTAHECSIRHIDASNPFAWNTSCVHMAHPTDEGQQAQSLPAAVFVLAFFYWGAHGGPAHSSSRAPSMGTSKAVLLAGTVSNTLVCTIPPPSPPSHPSPSITYPRCTSLCDSCCAVHSP